MRIWLFNRRLFRLTIREGGKKNDGRRTMEGFAWGAVQNLTIPSTQLSRSGVFVKGREGQAKDREKAEGKKNSGEISNRNILLDSAWHRILLNTAVIHSVIKKGNGPHSTMSHWNVVSKPPTLTVSYRELSLKDLSLSMALNGLYLNVTASVIVNDVANWSHILPPSSGSFTICPQQPRSLCSHRPQLSQNLCSFCLFSFPCSGGLDFFLP